MVDAHGAERQRLARLEKIIETKNEMIKELRADVAEFKKAVAGLERQLKQAPKASDPGCASCGGVGSVIGTGGLEVPCGRCGGNG